MRRARRRVGDEIDDVSSPPRTSTQVPNATVAWPRRPNLPASLIGHSAGLVSSALTALWVLSMLVTRRLRGELIGIRSTNHAMTRRWGVRRSVSVSGRRRRSRWVAGQALARSAR